MLVYVNKTLLYVISGKTFSMLMNGSPYPLVKRVKKFGDGP